MRIVRNMLYFPVTVCFILCDCECWQRALVVAFCWCVAVLVLCSCAVGIRLFRCNYKIWTAPLIMCQFWAWQSSTRIVWFMWAARRLDSRKAHLMSCHLITQYAGNGSGFCHFLTDDTRLGSNQKATLSLRILTTNWVIYAYLSLRFR